MDLPLLVAVLLSPGVCNYIFQKPTRPSLLQRRSCCHQHCAINNYSIIVIAIRSSQIVLDHDHDHRRHHRNIGVLQNAGVRAPSEIGRSDPSRHKDGAGSPAAKNDDHDLKIRKQASSASSPSTSSTSSSASSSSSSSSSL